MRNDAVVWLQTHIVQLVCFIGWLMILLPSIYYLLTTWRNRRDKLFARFGPETIRLYYKQFFPSLAALHEKSTDNRIQRSFRRHFESLHGRRHYVLPLALLGLISGIGLLATSRSIQVWLGERVGVQSFPAIAISAFLGAYAWVLYDQIHRFRTEDFTIHDVYSCVFRFLIAIPTGLSFAAFVKNDVGIPLVFFLAGFPTQTLFKLSRRIVTNNLGLGESGEVGPTELEQLQSISRSNAERYQDEGITTIAELAWADPVNLAIKTNREFSFVVDSISQALLWLYFESSVKKLYPLSLRGAQEVCTFLDDLDSPTPEVRAAAQLTLKTVASLTGIDEQVFRYTLLTVKEDPYSQFLFNIWT